MAASHPLYLKALSVTQNLVPTDDIIITPNFFIAIFAGVVLALAFQFILTAVSAAAGITAIGNLKKSYVKSKVNPDGNSAKEDSEFDQERSSDVSMGVKISTAFGIWSVVTTCIALFGASALALNLSVVESSQTNIVTSLVIWALFFLILFYLETKVAGSLLGNLISAATSGLKNSALAIGSMFQTSPEGKIKDIIGSTVDRVRSEFDAGMNTDKLSKTLDNFLSKVDKKVPDYDVIQSDLENIAKKSGSKNSSGKWMAAQQVLTKMISENSNDDNPEKQGKVKKIEELLKTMKERYDGSDGKVEGIKNVVEEFTSMERNEIDERTQRIKKFLGSSDSDGLSETNINAKFKEILNDPSVVTSMISNGYKDMDREKIVELLDKNTNLKRENLEKYADSVESAIHKITKEFDSENDQRMVKRLENSTRNYFAGTGRPELDYSLLKDDAKRIMDNPKDSLEVIKNRFSTFDVDTLRAVVTNNKYVDEKDIDKIVSTLENGKKEVEDKIAKIETTANQQIEILKRKAVIQAEHARATAVSAAWWLVLSTILSGVAAMVGSAVAL